MEELLTRGEIMEDDFKNGEYREVMRSLDAVLRNIKTEGLVALMNVVDREDGDFSPDLTLRVASELIKRKEGKSNV
jgi:hypothetical protein